MTDYLGKNYGLLGESTTSFIWRTLHKACEGDSQAWESIFTRYWMPVTQYTARYTGEEAEDVAQEVFLRLFKSKDQFEGRNQGFRYYLLKLLHQTLIDWFRTRNTQKRNPKVEIRFWYINPSNLSSSERKEVVKEMARFVEESTASNYQTSILESFFARAFEEYVSLGCYSWSLEGWLYFIENTLIYPDKDLQNKVVEVLKAGKDNFALLNFQRDLSFLPLQEVPEKDSEEALDFDFLWALSILQEILESLKEESRDLYACFYARNYEGLSWESLAQKFRISERMVQSLYSKAQYRVRKNMNKLLSREVETLEEYEKEKKRLYSILSGKDLSKISWPSP